MTTFPPIEGSAGVLDEHHRLLGEKRPCRFTWQVIPQGWAVVLTEPVQIEIEGDGYYVGLYADTGELMFTLPLVGRPKPGGNLTLGR